MSAKKSTPRTARTATTRKESNIQLYESLQRERVKTVAALVALVRTANCGATDEQTVKLAEIFYGVFNDRLEGNIERELPQSVRVLCEHFLGEACDRSDIHIWNNSIFAPLAWMMLAGISEAMQGAGEAPDAVLAGIKTLCTKGEYAEFQRRYGIEDGEPVEDTKQERDEMAAYKIARYLAHPITPTATKKKLGAAFFELAGEMEIQIDHPALVERAAAITFESMDTRQRASPSPVAKRLYERLHAMLDELPELPEGGTD